MRDIPPLSNIILYYYTIKVEKCKPLK